MSSKAKKSKREHSRSRSRSRTPPRKHKESKKSKSSHNNEHTDDNFKESLSVDETNKLRAQLGLPLLQVEKESEKDGKIKDAQYGDFYHVPAGNLSKTRKEEALKEKLALQKEKRETMAKLQLLKSVVSQDESSTLSWIEKQRRKQKAKDDAAKRAKELEELDNEFGVNDLSTRLYDSRDLSGMQIDHSLDRFREGKTVIMTLKDTAILDDMTEDTLINVNMIDDEKADKNRENIRKKHGFGSGKAIMDEDEDILSGLRSKGVLDKYDDESKTTLKLGSTGQYLADHERAMKQLEHELKYGGQSLAPTELRPVSDYYTEEEMAAKFKKRKKKTHSSRGRNTINELISRSTGKAKASAESFDTGLNPKIESILAVTKVTENDSKEVDSDEEWAQLHAADSEDEQEDEFQSELEKTLNRVRKVQQVTFVKPEEVAAKLLSQKEELDEQDKKLQDRKDDSTVTFDYTAEFYKSISNRFKEKQQEMTSARKHKSDRHYSSHHDYDNDDDDADSIGDLDLKPEELDAMNDDDQDDYRDSSRFNAHGDNPESAVTDDEPKLNSGLASALQFAMRRGFFDKDKNSGPNAVGKTVHVITAKDAVNDEQRFDDIDAKFSKRERYTGPLTEFHEKEDYKPKIKLDYIDEFGRQMGHKEAFKVLSHKFHGRTSGKKKTEKRLKKIQEEILLTNAGTSDTPLGTAEKLNRKLEADHVPYVVLSGGHSSSNMRKLSK